MSISVSPAFNLTGGVAYAASIIGMDISSTSPASNYIFDIGITVIMVNETILSISIYSESTVPTLMTKLTFNFAIINNGQYNQANFASFTSGSLNSSTPLSYTNTGIVYDKSTFIGIGLLHIQRESFWNMSTTFTGADSFTLSSFNQFSYLTVNYLLLLTYYCPYTTPYFITTHNTCIDTCPDRSFANLTDLTCDSCPYQCFTCDSSGNCLSCSASLDFR